ncbi:MAG: polysaccharide export protein [Desulfobulbaceae bacterium]|nr:polysaccharide export protein [Desulfobulbaceae bacterium]
MNITITAFLSFMLSLTVLSAPLYADDIEERSAYRLGSGDKLQVIVFNQKDLSGEYTINGTGRFSMPLIGSLIAAGNTPLELEEQIKNKLKPDFIRNPRVSIEVMNYRPFYIMGEVKEPNSYPYVDGMTYMTAVAIAGGFSYRAKKEYALVKRKNDENPIEFKVNMNEQVHPGDIIRIDERFF